MPPNLQWHGFFGTPCISCGAGWAGSPRKLKKPFKKGPSLPHIATRCYTFISLGQMRLFIFLSHGIMFPCYNMACCNCMIVWFFLFPSNPLIVLWGRKVLNEAFRWWEKQQTSEWQLQMMHGLWAKQRCSCMQQILLWSTTYLFNLLSKKGGCKFNPELSAVYRIWTDTLVFPHRES